MTIFGIFYMKISNFNMKYGSNQKMPLENVVQIDPKNSNMQKNFEKNLKILKKFLKILKKILNFFFQVGCLFPLNWRWGIQILKKFLKKIIFSDFSTYSRLFLAFFTWKSQISTWSRAQNKKCLWKMLFRMAHRTWKCKKTGGGGESPPPPGRNVGKIP